MISSTGPRLASSRCTARPVPVARRGHMAAGTRCCAHASRRRGHEALHLVRRCAVDGRPGPRPRHVAASVRGCRSRDAVHGDSFTHRTGGAAEGPGPTRPTRRNALPDLLPDAPRRSGGARSGAAASRRTAAPRGADATAGPALGRWVRRDGCRVRAWLRAARPPPMRAPPRPQGGRGGGASPGYLGGKAAGLVGGSGVKPGSSARFPTLQRRKPGASDRSTR